MRSEYGRLMYANKNDPEATQAALYEDYRKVAAEVGGLSPMVTHDLGPAVGAPGWHVWGWSAEGPDDVV